MTCETMGSGGEGDCDRRHEGNNGALGANAASDGADRSDAVQRKKRQMKARRGEFGWARLMRAGGIERGLDNKVRRELLAWQDDGAWRWEWSRDSVYRDGALLAAISSNPSAIVRHYTLDHLGTPRLLTDERGAVASQHTYFPYGEEATNSFSDNGKQTGEIHRFTGHERDLIDLGSLTDDLDYMHARYYSDGVGRFLSTDPIGGKTPMPQTWNRYAYALASPVRFSDPMGLIVNAQTDLALEEIRSTLPEELQKHVVLDANRNVSAEALAGVKSSDPNFLALREAVNLDQLFVVTTASAGTEPFDYESAESLVKTFGISPAEAKPGITYLGETFSAADSPNGSIRIVLSDRTGKAADAPPVELAIAAAEELYGHALFQARGLPWTHEPTGSGPVNKVIVEIEDRTRSLYEKGTTP